MRYQLKFPLWTLLCFLTATVVSCKKPDIKGEEITVQQVNVSFRDTQVKIPMGDSSYTKTAATVDIPLRIALSDAAPSRFNVGITVNYDTINQMIANNTLPDGVLLAPENYQLPSLVDVPFGQDHASFTLKVDLAIFEKYYGKTLALGIELTDPTKQNKLDATKKIVVVQISTTGIVPIDQIHYVYFSDAGKTISVPVEKPKNYTMTPGVLQVPLNVSYTSTAGVGFYLKLSPNQDTIAKLIAANALPGAVGVTAADFSLPDSITFRDFNNNLSFPVGVKLAALRANPGKKIALAVDLITPSVYKLDSAKRTIVMVVDAEGLKYNPYSGTPLQLPVAVGASVTIKAADFDLGGEGWGYHDNTDANIPGTYRPNEGVDIENSGGNIGFTADGEWLQYTVASSVTGDYDIGIALGTPNDGDRGVHVEVDGVNQTGRIAFTKTGDWSAWVYSHGTLHLTPGKHLVRFVWETGDTNLRDFVFTRKN